jgi:hypothetical protein
MTGGAPSPHFFFNKKRDSDFPEGLIIFGGVRSASAGSEYIDQRGMRYPVLDGHQDKDNLPEKVFDAKT